MADTITAERPDAATQRFISNFAKEMSETPNLEEPPAKEIVDDTPPDKGKASETPPVKPVVAAPDKPVVPAKEAPPVEAAESDDKWPRTAQEWKKFRAVRDEKVGKLQGQLKELTAKVTDYETKLSKTPESVAPPDYESIKQERDALSERLRVVAVTEHPRFKSYFETATNRQIELAKAIVGPEKAERIASLIKLPESQYRKEQIEDVVSDMSPLDQSRIGGILNALSGLEAEKQTEISRSKETFEQLQANEKSQREAKVQHMAKLFDDVIAKNGDPKEGVPLWQLRTGDEQWNGEVKARVEQAKALMFGQMKPEQMVTASLNAAAFPAALKALHSANEQIEALKKQVSEMASATPSPTGGQATGGGEEGGSAIQIKTGMRPQDVSAAWVKAAIQDAE